MSRIAVLGATGVVGRPLVARLAADGHDVIAVSRSGAAVAGERVELRAADIGSLAGARRAVAGADVVYYLVHSLGRSDYASADLAAATGVAQAAAEAGVRQIIYLGGLGDEHDDLSEHLRSRAEVGWRLQAGAVPTTVLRAAVIVGPGSAAFVTLVALVDRLPAMICPRWVATPTQPIALADVLDYLAGVCDRPEALGQTFDIGGPEVMSYRTMMQRVARIRGRRLRIIEVPILTPHLSSLWINFVTPVHADVARPLVEGLKNPTVCRDERILELVPFARTPFDVAAERALAGVI